MTVVMILVFGSLFLFWSLFSFDDFEDSRYYDEPMGNWNYIKWLLVGSLILWGTLRRLLRPKQQKSDIDKEILEYEKEIENLLTQKEKIEKLRSLKKRRDDLFREIEGENEMKMNSKEFAKELDNNYNLQLIVVGMTGLVDEGHTPHEAFEILDVTKQNIFHALNEIKQENKK